MGTSGSILGTRVQRIEDPALLRGHGTYIDNIAPAGAAHVAFVRAMTAHGRIESIDIEDARSMPGVVGVFTADDLDIGPLQSSPLLAHQVLQPILATGRVRYVGEPIVAVVAVTARQAVDAAEAVWADVEPLEAVIDPEAAARDEVVLFEDLGTNVVLDQGDAVGPDDLEGDVVVTERLVNQRMAAVPLEGRVAAARWDDEGRLTQWACTQGAHGTRDGLAAVFGIDPELIHVIAPDVGGGFGAKHGTTPEEILVAWLARRLGQPVRWTETRSENLVGMVQGRGQVQYASIAGNRDGTITGYRLDVIQEGGAYAGTGCVLPYMTRLMAPGCYAIDDVRVRIRSVVSNTSTVGAYRGAGRPEAAAAIERMVDMFADEIGMPAPEVRRKNLIAADAFPLRTATGGSYDSGDYEAVLDKALDAADYFDVLLREQSDRRRSDDVRQLGIGLSSYVEITNVLQDTEYGSVEITPAGGAIVRTGSSAHGQGHHTAWAMLVSDRTGIAVSDIEVRHGDTADIPRGTGTGGSKSLQLGGAAAAAAAELVVDEARALAARLLEANPDDIVHDVVTGSFAVAGTPVSAKSWADLAAAAPDAGVERLFAENDFTGGGSTFPFGAHVAVVEVDTETGAVRLLRHIACDDAGTIINPLIFDGQVHGGVAAGISQALFEEVRYDEDGNPLTTTLADYSFPSAAEFPSFERVAHETTTPHNPLGAKGIGEAGTIGATPAVQNAVVDAVSHLGVRHIDMPLTPERVWTAIRAVSG